MDDVPAAATGLRIAARVAAILAALILLLALSAALLERHASWLRGPIERRASVAAGRPVRILGPLGLRLFSLAPRLEVHDLRIADPAFAPAGALVSVPAASAAIRLLPLLRGRLIVERMEIDAPLVRLWRDASGRDNWDLGAHPARQGPPRALRLPVIRGILLRDGRIEFRDARRALAFAGVLNATDDATAGAARGALRVTGEGQINGKPFELRLHGDSLRNLVPDSPYRLAVELQAAGTRLAVDGSIDRPFDLDAFQARLRASGPDLADLYFLTGLPFVNTARYELEGDLRRRGARIDIEHLSGRLGATDVRGRLDLDLAGERPRLAAELESTRLDLADLLPAFGAAARNGGGPAAPASQKIAGSVAPSSGILPDASLDVERLRGADARLRYRATDLVANRLQLRQLDLTLRLQSGVLTLDPLVFTLPEGRVNAELSIDAQGAIPRSRVDVRIRDIRLQEFAGADPAHPPLAGELQARAVLAGTGASVHAVAASADGKLTAVLPGGAIRKSFAELAGINLLRGLGLLLANDRQATDVRCGVAAFQVRDGRMDVSKLVIDTDPVLIEGKGSVDLGPETWDLALRGEPKRPQLLHVGAPITVTGPLGKPRVGIDKGSLVKQFAVAGALALATPVAALLAFVDPGLAKNANCAALLEAAEPQVRRAARGPEHGPARGAAQGAAL